ncbi:hypothetical protein A2943_01740 [Candidatus Adlerbacteria bacterium RIFCSPLOWO2_01_FULL_51_16]|uniref:Glycosyltransferase subfamily 4-like N-terminal domain-containing protein n=1 Tax=Candidatus Adlerbacteria bacterium RIFCSPLOWO2_01_FULL_51_16 TaxID=1797243 RepID=A0A1F4XH88_9BACT|nr:MAG: hypothetical protein A2943_01740 [Candidatus Adlerbacteria bacterium RIFCSPLOWO2_01_FULL_51_16]
MNTRNLRIALICDGVAEFMAGSTESARRFSRILKGRGYTQVFIAGRSPEHRTDDEWEGMKVYRFRSFLLPQTDGHLYLGLPRKREVIKILQEERIDILHVIMPTPAAIAAVRAAHAIGIPVVVHSHTQPENLFLNTFHNKAEWFTNILSSLMYVYLHWLYAKVAVLIFPTKFSREFFKGLPQKSRTEVISNGVDRTKFGKADPAPLLKKFNLPADRTYILFVGRLHPEKRVDTLIAAMPAILKGAPGAHALIVGGGHREQALRAQAASLGITERVSFLGRLSDAEVEQAYNAAALFVLPSLVELEGMVVLQAISCGVPVLVSNSPKSASPLLVEGNGLLFKPSDAADLAAQALAILTNPERRKSMAAQSLLLGEKYDIQTSASKIESIYHSLMSTR